MTERERILDQMADAIERHNPGYGESDGWHSRRMAEACLAVLETPISEQPPYYVICTCGQNGYPPGSIHSNHDHLEGCPHYAITE